MNLVELCFRHYVLGLARAGSPYAYHSLGSALGVSLPHYAQARGFPRRAAGEDFYLLDKLARLAPLRRLRAPVIEVSTRVSDRVPFGTGPALSRARSSDAGVTSYHPDSFQLLKLALETLSHQLDQEQSNWEDTAFIERAGGPTWLEEQMKTWWQKLSPTLIACPSSGHRMRRLHEVVDALQTLKLIHRAHREGLSMLPVSDAVTLGGFADPGSTEALLAQLRAAEEGLPEWVGPSVSRSSRLAVAY
jgi:hypothetical protein